MNKCPIYTIGYGNRPFIDFLKLLKTYSIKYLIDVRSKPFSRQIDFNKSSLENSLKRYGIRYVFMGDVLGGQPDNPECYTNGRTDYRKLQSQDTFKHGINRLEVAYEKQLYVAIMCSEEKPQSCHRSKLIGQELIKRSIDVCHIDEKGKKVSQEDVILRITNGQESIFSVEEQLLFSRKRIY